MPKEGAVMELTLDQYQRALEQKASNAQYEAILGSDAAQVVEWFDLLLVSAQDAFSVDRFWADCTIIMFGFNLR
jgi:hypothetical protein